MVDLATALSRLLARPIAHRGLHACGGAGPAENTIAAAQAATAGDYGIECDVQLTSDGEVIVFHDDTLDRLTGSPARVGERTVADIAALALYDGSPIPTLGAFLAAIGGRAPVVIEIKSLGDGDMRLADATLKCLAGYSGVAALESFDPAIVAQCRDATCPIGLVGPADGDTIDPDALPRCDFLSWNIENLAAITANYPHLPRTTWTVRSEAHVAAARACGAQIVFEGFRP